MNKYFAEYIPVAGAIREGDKFYDSKFPLLGVKTARWDTESKTQKKMKLHLCSHDIQVGDEFILPDEYMDMLGDMYRSNKVTCTSISEDVYHYSADLGEFGTAHSGVFKEDSPYKIMGPISPLANWVKQGDEFSEDQILRYLASDYEYKIKGQCGRFY